MPLACSRSLFFTVFIAGAVVLGLSYYLEYAVGLKPCGLCLMQRMFLALLTGICLVAAVHGPGRLGSALYWLSGLSSSLAGTVTALRQVVLQSDPAHQLIANTFDLGHLFASAPWAYVVQLMFNGTIDCAQISWTLFGLSIAEWSLLFFIAMMILSVYQLLRLIRISLQRPLSGELSRPLRIGD